MSVEKLGKLRNKLKEITEYIETADQRKTEAKHAIVDATARLEKAETEVQSSRRRIQLIKQDLKDASDRLSVAEEKLEASTNTSDEVEATRQELENKESEDDAKIQKLEEQNKSMKRALELNELKLVEAQRKKTVFTRDIDRVKEKADTFETRVSVLEETIANHGQSLQELETREGEAGEREQLNEEKVHFLEGQLKETEVRAEAAERGCAVAERNILETENEINSWIQKREEIEHEMIEMDDVADDPAYVMAPGREGGYTSDSSRSTAKGLKDKLEMFNKKKETTDDEASSRASSRAGQNKDESEPESAPETPEPPAAPPAAPAEEEEEEDFWGNKSGRSSRASAASSNKAAESEATEEDDESEEESDEEDDWFKKK